MFGSGLAELSTNSDTAINLVNVPNYNGGARDVYIINRGSVQGAFSIDGGSFWQFLPPGPISIGPLRLSGQSSILVQAKRVPSGSDLTGLSAFTN